MVYIRLNNFFVYGVHQLFSANVGGAVVNKLLFRFSICGYVPEIFANRDQSKVVRNRAEFWTTFCPRKFITSASRNVDRKSFMKILPL